MNWNQLQYVITIAEEKSITKAAQKLYISQPSLSLSIQALEKETGIPLFERNRGEMKLTYAGSLFYEWAISTLHSHTQLEWKLGDIVSGSRTLIRLGLSPHRSERLLAPVLERFYSMYENCDIQIIEQPTYILRQMLEEDKLDLILDISSPDTINYESELLVKESKGKMKFVIETNPYFIYMKPRKNGKDNEDVLTLVRELTEKMIKYLISNPDDD